MPLTTKKENTQISTYEQIVLLVPELTKMYIPYEHIHSGLGSTYSDGLSTVYKLYDNEDIAYVCELVEEYDGLSYRFNLPLIVGCDGSEYTTWKRMGEVMGEDKADLHKRRMDKLLFLLNTDPETQELNEKFNQRVIGEIEEDAAQAEEDNERLHIEAESDGNLNPL